jgi:phage baseplate assembly protein W
MPTPLTWPLDVPSTGHGPVEDVPQRRFYAHARLIDPQTGEAVFDETTGSEAEQQPIAAVIAAVMRTPLGSALHDPSFGVDYSQLETARTGSDTTAINAVRKALERWTKRGVFTLEDVRVGVFENDIGAALAWEIDFIDPRDKRQTAKGVI